ncbi:G kinase-anchoring protein 1-like [Anneissia japonica]|uniref:G kinase-anchoring protein 1-like n=1 Tax=Anneissia japonica TaxID=1529436 RepID=UPI00142582CB|nr:G kinase-anchoring protein 1-like [Anneissia japonica]
MSSKSLRPNNFTCLQVESLSDNEDQSEKIDQNPKSVDNQNVNQKKRARRKKKRQEKAEIRDIAFGKIPSVNCKPAVQSVVVSSTQSNGNNFHQISGDNPKVTTQQWDSWKERDENQTEDQFAKDLHEAILQSQLAYEHQQKFLEAVQDVDDIQDSQVNKKVKKKQGKEKPHPISLQEFQKPPEPTSTNIDHIQLPAQVEADSLFFEKVKEDASKILTKEHIRKVKKDNEKLISEKARRLQYEDTMEKKEKEAEVLHEEITKLKEELSQVKKRNKQLCFILAQGEMKDKADVLKQVEELNSVKDELTEEVCQLHASLEQERSKVSSLQSEMKKLLEKKK